LPVIPRGTAPAPAVRITGFIEEKIPAKREGRIPPKKNKGENMKKNSATSATPDGLQYEKNERGITITKYTGTAAALVIPAEIEGLPVTEIRNDAFGGCRGLTGITIPDSVTAIGFAAFADCRSLNGITIPAGVRPIGDCAFAGCINLTSVIIPAGVRTIGKYVLVGCGNAGCRANKETRHE
jgi:hypothetical protein